MKILVSTDCFLPRWDGIARFLTALLPSLAKHHEVTVLAPAFPGFIPRIHGVKIVRVPILPLNFGDIRFAWFPRKVARALVRDQDIVFNQTLGPIGISTIRAAAAFHVPVVTYAHSVEWELAAHGFGRMKNIVRTGVKTLSKWLYNHCKCILVPSSEMADILASVGVKVPKQVVPLGIDTTLFHPPLNRTRARRKLGFTDEDFVIGYHGRIAREKNLPTLVAGFRKIRDTHRTVRLLVVGTGLEGEVPRERGIVLPGATDTVVNFLQAMDAYVLPSLTETSSLATMEAMAVGLPVITTPVGSIPAYVKDGKNGFLFARKDVAELVEKLELLYHYPELRTRLGIEARKTILERYKWADTMKLISALLRENARTDRSDQK